MNATQIVLAGSLALLMGHVACNGAMHTGRKGSGGAGEIGSADGGGAGGIALGGGGGLSLDGGAGAVMAAGGVGGAGGIGGEVSGGAGGPMVAGGAAGAAPAGGGAAGSSVRRSGAGGNIGGSDGGQSGAATALGGSGGAGGGAGGSPFEGVGGAKIAGTVGTTPIGERPSSWSPPFVGPLADPGWQDSTSPICETNIVGYDSAFDVWADARGVFALMSSACSDGNYPCTVFDASVQLNTGSGWQVFHEFPADTTSYPTMLGGFPQGPLIMAGSFDKQFGMAFLDENGLTFQGSMVGPAFATKSAAGGDLAYAFDGKQMVKYSAGSWSQVGEAGQYMGAVWTDGRAVVAVGADQTVLVGPVDGALTKVAKVPAGDYTSVWGFGANDLWLSNGAQLMHFDGSNWQAHETGIVASGIVQLWGDSGIVYFRTETEFGRWNGSSVEILLRPPTGTKLSDYPGSFGRFWGRSANEVFLPLRDARYKSYTCSSAFMLYFDGSQFHQF